MGKFRTKNKCTKNLLFMFDSSILMFQSFPNKISDSEFQHHYKENFPRFFHHKDLYFLTLSRHYDAGGGFP